MNNKRFSFRLFAFALALVSDVYGQVPQYTVVTATVRKVNGMPFQGVYYITPAIGCTMVNTGQPFTRTTVRYCVGSKGNDCDESSSQQGLFSMQLLATSSLSTTSPTGCYYNVKVVGTDGVSTSEIWDVPPSSGAPVSIATIRRTSSIPVPGTSIPLGLIASGEPDGDAIFDGGRLVSTGVPPGSGTGSATWLIPVRTVSQMTDFLCGEHRLIPNM